MNMQMIILGDLNFNYQIDESLSSNPIHLIENLFQMSQIIEEPMQKTPTMSTLLDVILTSVPDRHTKTKVIKTAFSNHYSLFTTTTLWNSTITKILMRKHSCLIRDIMMKMM